MALSNVTYFSSENSIPPTDYYDTTGDFVYLCDKDDVNRFGAKFIPAVYYVIFMLSFLGNGLVLHIIFKYETLNTTTNIFILNLVISDLVFAFSLPFLASYHSSEWIFGRGMCKLIGSIYFIGFYSSILFLTLMTFDRYLAVVYAVTAAKKRRILYAFVSSLVTWSISILASIKEFIFYDVREDKKLGTLCEETGYSAEVMNKWKMVGYYQQFVLFFLFPLIVVTYCYSRIIHTIFKTKIKEKARAVKLIFIIVVTFFLCWTPYNIVVFLKSQEDRSSCSDGLDYALYVTRNIAYLYCCVCPVFYTFLGKKFQNHLAKVGGKWVPLLRIQSITSQSGKITDQRSPQTMCE
ncbi:chemokine (C-C motif) receptor 12a [Erpetoichthys calabaricus]|uniref:chemokine (C-C motif) receptor 12a n=1 Tax=Erpetoichthys calabaricus TaxID=27687 RepID=UPI0010A08F00|nr:chemokine (C-C motif) receptor 12a [Erpetoichthys calabaricus]